MENILVLVFYTVSIITMIWVIIYWLMLFILWIVSMHILKKLDFYYLKIYGSHSYFGRRAKYSEIDTSTNVQMKNSKNSDFWRFSNLALQIMDLKYMKLDLKNCKEIEKHLKKNNNKIVYPYDYTHDNLMKNKGNYWKIDNFNYLNNQITFKNMFPMVDKNGNEINEILLLKGNFYSYDKKSNKKIINYKLNKVSKEELEKNNAIANKPEIFKSKYEQVINYLEETTDLIKK